jgi:cytochrome o ubiquinol oxidase subunit II
MKRVVPRRLSRWPLGVALLTSGCRPAHWPVLDPAGPVGLGERNLILVVIGLMLLVVIPVFVMTFWFAWRYRASNRVWCKYSNGLYDIVIKRYYG